MVHDDDAYIFAFVAAFQAHPFGTLVTDIPRGSLSFRTELLGITVFLGQPVGQTDGKHTFLGVSECNLLIKGFQAEGKINGPLRFAGCKFHSSVFYQYYIAFPPNPVGASSQHCTTSICLTLSYLNMSNAGLTPLTLPVVVAVDFTISTIGEKHLYMVGMVLTFAFSLFQEILPLVPYSRKRINRVQIRLHQCRIIQIRSEMLSVSKQVDLAVGVNKLKIDFSGNFPALRTTSTGQGCIITISGSIQSCFIIIPSLQIFYNLILINL